MAATCGALYFMFLAPPPPPDNPGSDAEKHKPIQWPLYAPN